MSDWTRKLLSDPVAKDWIRVSNQSDYEWVTCSIPSPSREDDNEDGVCILEAKNRGLFVVADGLGGQKAGGQASNHFLSQIHSKFQNQAQDKSESRNQFLDLIEESNQNIMDWGQGAGTTCSAVLVEKNRLRSFQVGDSRVLLVGQKGKIKFESTSHSPVGYALEAGLLKPTEALSHPEAHIVFNSLGFQELYIEIGPSIEMSSADTLLIASDGLTDNLETELIVEKIRKGPLEEVIQSLINLCHEKMKSSSGKEDDLSIVLMRLTNQS